MHDNREQPQTEVKRRRSRATVFHVEQIIAAGQRRGLMPSAIILHADGSTEVRYSDTSPAQHEKPKGWTIKNRTC
jgi:GT2 family glycosyltransferase